MNTKRIKDIEMVQSILQVLGVLHNQNPNRGKFWRMLYTFHPYFLFIPCTVIFAILLWLEVLRGEEFNTFLASLNLAITFTAFALKLKNTLKQSKLIEPLLNEWRESPICELRSPCEHSFWLKTQNLFQKVSIIYLVSCCTIIVPLALVPISTGFTTLPVKFFHPFDISDRRTFWLLFCYEVISFLVTCIANTAIDMFNCGLMLHVALFINLTTMRLEALKTEETDNEFYEKLINIIKFHEKNIKRYYKITESILSTSILSVVSSSSFMICSNTYLLQQLSILSNPSASLYNMQYIFGASAQIFLPCYYGNMIFYNSQNLATNIYSSNWLGRSKRIRQSIYFFMVSVNKPMILRAGNFFTVDFQTFTKVIRAAYQLLAVLANMNN